jgi:hypothetical protein
VETRFLPRTLINQAQPRPRKSKVCLQHNADGNRTVLWDNYVSYSNMYGYDGLGRMTHDLEGFGAPAFRLTYDSRGGRSSLGLGSGTATSTISYAWDNVGRLQAMTRDLAGSSGDQILSFTYNPASQIATRSSSNNAYAAAGANTVRPYAANGLNQYTAAGDATFEHDSNGNLKSVANVPEGSTSFVYDAENRLVSASGARNASLAYDPMGGSSSSSRRPGHERLIADGQVRLARKVSGANPPPPCT